MTQQSIHDRIMARDTGPTANAAPAAEAAPKRHWTRVVLASVLGLAAVGGAGVVALQFPAVVEVFAQGASADATKPAPALPETPFLEHVKQAGIKTCGTVFPVLGQLLAEGTEYNVQSQWHNAEPDKHSVQAFVGMKYSTPTYAGPAAGFVFASPNGAACEGSMVRIAPFPKNCAEMPAVLPAGSTLASTLGPIPVYNVANNGGQILLLPSDQSCIVISVTQAAG
ncbi:hypothetical protein FY150_24620 (plasmid) [Agrobacterium tumefaciens]|nr:hypothetical protein FY150_24620 [Agrobacterium tumefaciens]